MATRMTSLAAILNILPFARDKKWSKTRKIILAMWRWVTHSDATFTFDIIVLKSKMASEMTINFIVPDLVDISIIM